MSGEATVSVDRPLGLRQEPVIVTEFGLIPRKSDVDRQLYAIGQIVSVTLRSLSGPRTNDHFRIVRRYLIGNRRAMYHVRSIVDRSQRMVPEDELSIVMPSLFERSALSGKVLQLFPQVVRFDRAATP